MLAAAALGALGAQLKQLQAAKADWFVGANPVDKQGISLQADGAVTSQNLRKIDPPPEQQGVAGESLGGCGQSGNRGEPPSDRPSSRPLPPDRAGPLLWPPLLAAVAVHSVLWQGLVQARARDRRTAAFVHCEQIEDRSLSPFP